MRFQVTRHLDDLGQKLDQLQAARKGGPSLLEAAPGAGLPPPEFNWRDYVNFLLYIDAEIEHGLMVQYLYGAYSLGGPQVPEQYREIVRGWQEIILGIAKEEMGHLISVQNVLRLIGAPLNLGREDYPWDTPFYPFPFMLEPLSLDSLAKYVYAEAPEDWTKEPITDPIAQEVVNRVKKMVSDPHHVSELFDLMIKLVEDPFCIPDETFQANTYLFQAQQDEWSRGYQDGARGNTAEANRAVASALPDDAPDFLKKASTELKHTPNLLVAPLASRDDTVSVLKEIAEQGEAGPTDTQDPSHFTRFLTIYLEMKQLEAADGWQANRNVAFNPYMVSTVDEEAELKKEAALKEEAALKKVYHSPRDLITNPEAKLWGNLFNLRYRMLLNYLAHSFELMGGLNQAGEWTPRGTIINATFGEMYNLRAIANLLMQTPLSDGGGDKLAGPPFLMPYTLNLPTGESNRWRLHQDLLLAAEPLITQLLQQSPAVNHKYLLALREADQKLLGIVERILAGSINLALT
jgi:ferritin-like protein